MRTQKVTVKSRRRRRVAIITVIGSLLVAMALPLTGYVANPHQMYEAIGEHCRAISGAINDAMSRDDL